MSTYTLTQSQIDTFKREGYLVVRNLVDQTVLEDWRAQWTTRFGSLGNPETWEAMRKIHLAREYTTVLRDVRFEPESKWLMHQPGVSSVVSQLGGGQFWGDDSNPHILWPDQTEPWIAPESGHIDGYAGGRHWPFVLGSTSYLFDVERYGGGTVFWPGSHIKTWEYFRRHPDQVEIGLKDRDAYLQSLAEITPTEITAKAGDVIFWHSNLYHSASQNASDSPRFGLFARYHHKRQDEIKFDVPDDMWQNWGV